MTRKIKTPQQLAQEHWDWLKKVLAIQWEMEEELYVGAFIHGYKHGKDGKERRH